MEEGITGSSLSRITRQLETGETEDRGHQGTSHRPRRHGRRGRDLVLGAAPRR